MFFFVRKETQTIIKKFMKLSKSVKLICLVALLFSASTAWSQKVKFNDSWKFHLVENNEAQGKYEAPKFDDSKWENISLPHNAHNEPLLVNDQWQGECWYRKNFDIESYSTDKKYIIEFEASMNHTLIWINGEMVSEYQGGYLPIVIDATSYLKEDGNVIALKVNNTDNEVTGPKPLAILDFNMYGGLYRNAWFTTKEKVHITNSILANTPASGGVFITFPKVSTESSKVRIQTHVANENTNTEAVKAHYEIFDNSGASVQKLWLNSKSIAKYGTTEFVATLDMDGAKLWSPQTPNLYTAKITLYNNDKLIDTEIVRFGIRKIQFKNNQLYLNGKKTYLRGVNRHQEYPYIGYALSDNAQFRDAKKIKDAGFDYVRLSHYPQSPAFMAACDSLGLMVADAILGWQYYNETHAFKSQMYRSARELIRRDRNHACVLAWEVSLNETAMPINFMKEIHRIAHEEYPGENMYTCGWMADVYDIYFQARQHRIGHPDKMTFKKPYMVSEYGDWEYYSRNAGLNQHNHSAEKRLELSSRQLRSAGEKGQLQQAFNLQESHNDNMNIPATGDSYWVMYDYNRGYHDEIESSGIMDIFRLPKFGYYFYQSQRPASETQGAMVKIASYWDKNSDTNVRVFSNCDEVKLYCNNRLFATQKADSDKNSTNLNCPPFTFNIEKYKAGELRAEGYIAGKKVAEDKVRSPRKASKLKIWIDESGVEAEAGCNDVVFLYIAATDSKGTIIYDFEDEIKVEIDGKVEIMNTDGIQTEEGIATVLLRIGQEKGTSTVKASTDDRLKGELKFEIQ